MAYPVNFTVSDGSIIFRTSDAMTANITGVVAFEVDHIDEAMSEGWSVLVRGHARRIEISDANQVAHVDPDPWAGGSRLNLIGIDPFETDRSGHRPTSHLVATASRHHVSSRTLHPFTHQEERRSHHEGTRLQRTRIEELG